MSSDISQEQYEFFKTLLIIINSFMILCLLTLIIIASVLLDENKYLVNFVDDVEELRKL